MGALFELKHANIVTYLTTPAASPPRLRARDLIEFVDGFAHGNYGQPPFISSDPNWAQRMQDIVSRTWSKLPGWSDEIVLEETVEAILSDLRNELLDYDFFGFVVGNQDDHDETSSLAQYLAHRSRSRALFLIPVPSRGGDPLTVLDPLPAFAPALEQRHNWPGILFWSRSGTSAFAPTIDAAEVCERILNTPSERQTTHGIDDVLRSYRSYDRGIHILHLSDLHYGRPEAAENEVLLLAELDSYLDTVHRVIITGDLFDNPKREDHVLFRNFRANILRRSGSDPVVVPGNHDQKWLGNVRGSRRQIADLEWSNLVLDENAKCVFFCFDSSRDADFARGKVSVAQLRDVATAFETIAVKNRDVRTYLPVALVHHHPFSFEVAQETLVQRFLSTFGWTDEQFLRMEDADAFVSWLARRKIPLVLHGHKHVQRHVHTQIQVEAEYRHLTAVGCGTSLGAEGYPLSYNLLIWDPVSRTWSASFFADPGDGSGFTRQCITMQSVSAA